MTMLGFRGIQIKKFHIGAWINKVELLFVVFGLPWLRHALIPPSVFSLLSIALILCDRFPLNVSFISTLQVSWQRRRQEQNPPRERPLSIVHRPSSPSGASSAAASAAIRAAGRDDDTPCFTHGGWPVEAEEEEGDEESDSFYSAGGLRGGSRRAVGNRWLLFGTKLCLVFTDKRWTEPTIRRLKRGRDFEETPPHDHQETCKETNTLWY